MEILIYTAIIVAAICWAIHIETGEDGLLWPIVRRIPFLKHSLISGCPKCMPTLYAPIISGYLIWCGYPIELYEIPVIWLTSCGINALIIRILDNVT